MRTPTPMTLIFATIRDARATKVDGAVSECGAQDSHGSAAKITRSSAPVIFFFTSPLSLPHATHCLQSRLSIDSDSTHCTRRDVLPMGGVTEYLIRACTSIGSTSSHSHMQCYADLYQRAPKDLLITAESRALSDGAALPPLATRRAPRGTRLGTAVKLRCVHRSRRSTGPGAPGLIYRARGRKTWMDRGPLFRRS